jgi:tetratricopeptide (TPR) repeat protein
MAIAAIGLIAAVMFRAKESSSDAEDSGARIWTYGLAVSIVVAVAVWFASGGAFFWRNISSGPLALFGRLDRVILAYSDLPLDKSVTDLWAKPAWIRLLSCVMAAAYVLVLVPIAKRLAGQYRQLPFVYLYIALSGTLIGFASTGDFAIMLILFAVLSALILAHIDGKVPIWQPAVAVAVCAAFHTVFVSILLVFLVTVLMSGSSRASGRLRWLVPMAGVAAGAAASLISQSPFVSILLGKRLADLSLLGTQLPGFANQLLMVSGVLWLIAFSSMLYAFSKWSQFDRKVVFISGWFCSGTAFSLLSYSQYGWIVGAPASVIVVFPTLLWLALFFSRIERATAVKCFSILIVSNLFVAISLLWAAGSSVGSARVLAQYASSEPAFDVRFRVGRMGLLLGTGLTERIGAIEEALPALREFNSRFPADPVGRYECGWALANDTKTLLKGLELLEKLETSLAERDRFFWEFNYRLGIKFLHAHNGIRGIIALERAAAESTTLEISQYLAYAYDGLKVWDSVGSKFEQVAALGDTTPEVFFKIADAAAKVEDSARALYYFKYGIERFPAHVPNYEYVARYYFLNGKYDSLETLANYGLSHTARSIELESCLLLVYQYTGRYSERDSLYERYLDYYQTRPFALHDWGIFLEENGLTYLGRKAQAADVTANWPNLKALLDFYWYYLDNKLPDSAKSMVDRLAEGDTTTEVLRVLDAVKRYNPGLWPDYKRDSAGSD